MRILLISKRFDFGGSENHVCDLANGLARAGHQVWVAARAGRQVKRLIPPVCFVQTNISDWRLPFALLSLIRFLAREKIELIHAHQRLGIRLACLMGLLTGIPVVATVHGRTRHDLGNYFFRRVPRRIIFVSKHVQKRAARFSCLTNKSVYIPNGLNFRDCGRFCSDRLLYVSRLDRRHGELLSMMIEKVLPILLKERPHLTLQVFGEGKGLRRAKQAAEMLTAQTGHDVVIFHGFRPESQITLEGSLLMGVGRTAIKGLAAGLPVLSVNQKHLGALITPENYPALKESNFVEVAAEKPTPQTLLARLAETLSNLELHASDRSMLQAMVIQDFNMEAIVQRIEWVYQTAVQHPFGAFNLRRRRAADVPSMRRA